MEWKITNSHLHKLQATYHEIDSRGICVSPAKIKSGLEFIYDETKKHLAIASRQWNCTVFSGAANDDGSVGAVNINATKGNKTLLGKLKDIGYDVPKVTQKNTEGDWEQKESANELVLQKLLVANQFGHVGGDPAIKAILKIKELEKLKGTYFKSRFYKKPDGQIYFLSNYNVAGTITGRRGSRKHVFGYGGNAQTIPKHGDYSDIFREALIARPGNIFLMVDQKSAESWPVLALAEDLEGIKNLQDGINPHIRRAVFVFNIPEHSRTEKEWKKSHEYYLGKKLGHANNYGMKAGMMSDSLAKEGFAINKQMCEFLLQKANLAEPRIDGVFHKYVQQKLYKTRILSTPFGRERQFLGIRPNDPNNVVFNEAYSYIPQSVVGDNTGFAVQLLESELPIEKRAIVQEGHDSIVQDIPRDADVIWDYLKRTLASFVREIRFNNGIEIEIPIEAELGFNFKNTEKINDLSYDGVVDCLARLQS